MSRLAMPVSALAIVGASIALVACGNSSSDSASSSGGSGAATTTNGTSANGSQSAATQKFRQCLQDNGVTLPDRGQGRPEGGYGQQPPGTDAQPPTGTNGTPPAGGFGGAGNSKLQKAIQACAKYRPQGFGNRQGGNGQGPQQDIKAFTPYLNCLKGKGLDIKVSDGFDALRNLKQNDPEVQAAFKACQRTLPQRNRQGGGTGTTAGTTSS